MNDLNPTPEFEEKVRQAMDVPGASPEFVNKLRNDLVRGPVKMKSRVMFKPVWAVAFVLALAVLVMSVPGVAAALGRLFGYVPDVGLIENTGNLQMLAEPVSVTRDGITLTITQAIAYEDHLELTYKVDGITETYGNEPDMCGSVHPNNDFWSDADADLRLPDDTIVRRDYAGEFQSVNQFAMQLVYAVHIPADVHDLTMVLKCIPFTKLGDVPENWEVPFKLKTVPAGTVLGAPVIEVVQPTATQPAKEPVATTVTEASNLPNPIVTMKLEKIVPLESATVFYLSMDMENRDPSLISIMPVQAYVIDSQGQKIRLIGNYVLQPFEHRVGSLFQFTSESKPADGALTVVIENATAFYAPMYTDPPQATPEEMSFTFDAGGNPQQGQIWELNKEIKIAGYPVRIKSVKAVTWDEVQEPSFIDGSQGYEYGYQFAVESDPSVKMIADMDIMSESPMCGLTVGSTFFPQSSSMLYTSLCRDRYPGGEVKVTIWQLAVMMENSWQATYTP
jgi:hypothetical protein